MEEKVFKFGIEAEDKGKRLDRFLTDKMSDSFSRAFVQKIIGRGGVLVNGVPVKSNHKVIPGEAVEMKVSETAEKTVLPEKIKLDIIYEDKDLLVVNKPADMVVHPAPGNYTGTLVNALLYHSKNLSGVGGMAKAGIVHRIDKGTSGLLVVAKTDEAHRKLARQFKDKTTRRVYIAVAKGVMELDNGIVELPIARSMRDRKKMAVDFASDKTAVTQYKVLERFDNATLLELILGTGRTHQIRVHMAYLGHPIIGDTSYGNRSDSIARPALHAKVIGFMHPASKEYMEFTSELPADMKRLIAGLRSKKGG